MHATPLPYPGSLTDVSGLEVGHDSDPRRPTGCSVVLARVGAIAGVDVRGAAPGTRETDLLQPGNLVQQVHAVLLSGGSAWGLDAASGVMRWLEENGVGLDTGHGLVPIVPAAVIFDLGVGDGRIRPDAQAGYRACQAASRSAPAQGNVGAGSGALVGKLMGPQRAMKGGVGTASLSAGGCTVGALVVCNAVGDVLDPATGRLLAGARTADGRALQNTRDTLLQGHVPQHPLAGRNTTIGVIATDAVIDKAQAQRLAQMAHDGLARSINPVHTQLDGDTLFALGTGASGKPADMLLLATLAAEVTARAVVNAVHAARGLSVGTQHWPAMTDLMPH
jgi:L-aminopeptidase/D-esterase-like protein